MREGRRDSGRLASSRRVSRTMVRTQICSLTFLPTSLPSVSVTSREPNSTPMAEEEVRDRVSESVCASADSCGRMHPSAPNDSCALRRSLAQGERKPAPRGRRTSAASAHLSAHPYTSSPSPSDSLFPPPTLPSTLAIPITRTTEPRGLTRLGMREETIVRQPHKEGTLAC